MCNARHMFNEPCKILPDCINKRYGVGSICMKTIEFFDSRTSFGLFDSQKSTLNNCNIESGNVNVNKEDKIRYSISTLGLQTGIMYHTFFIIF